MRIGALVLLVWLVIGVSAAVQRDYFDDGDTSCAEAGTIVVTVLAGPLNYLGVNPKVDCDGVDIDLPEPSS